MPLPLDGPLRQAYEARDWAATPIGPPAGWGPTLRGTLDLALNTRVPVSLFWGPELVLLYNEAYLRLIGAKHPAALGSPAREVFPEAWTTIGPWMRRALTGEATWVEDAPVPLERHGFLEECYFTFCYSPVRGEDGTVEGVIDIASETTSDVLARRRMALLGRLGAELGDVQRVEDLPRRVLPLLRSDPADLPAVGLRMGPGSTGPEDRRLPPAPRGQLGAHDILIEDVHDGRVAWLPLVTAATTAEPAQLAVLLSEHLAHDEDYVGFLRLIATALGQTLDRVGGREAERSLSEALQRSLLTRPLQPDHLRIAARYQPAAQQAQIGGDWYDTFLMPGGALVLVIGDVAGHDQHAAAAMAQVRNLLRGVAQSLDEGPSAVLAGLDRAMHGLHVDVFATAVLARVEQGPEDAARGLRTLRWANAGHPPPVLIAPDGSSRLLQGEPDPLLGFTAATRADHTVTLEPGATVVLYTDGLVERRGVSLDQSLAWLEDELAGRQGLSPEELCDHLIGTLEGRAEDDIALLVLSADPET